MKDYHRRFIQGAVLVFGLSIQIQSQQINFENAFENCHMDDPEFDHCIKDALNNVRPYFKTGVPQWNIPPFDPFFAKEVVQTTGIPMFHYNLKLMNVTESGWTVSQVTSFKSDFNKNLIEYTQFFPEKFLNGHYDFTGSVFGNKLSNAGTWNLALYDFIQTTQISKPRGRGRDKSLRVKVTVHTCRDMKLHISHLLGGRRILEILMDRIINAAWPPGFMILRPLVNDLVSTAFTDIFNGVFQEFPFNDLIKE
ncbi:uncharacterized protein [Onthophagus taurus]|uniref:uncharacterized protein isoform X2 n=1 Tax=Onthophagus taurus TaxID=166361 RepID=UPI000C1FFC8E|nr:uncharacterized protein LOC111423686 isoform X2 [Onthophagus taurus]